MSDSCRPFLAHPDVVQRGKGLSRAALDRPLNTPEHLLRCIMYSTRLLDWKSCKGHNKYGPAGEEGGGYAWLFIIGDQSAAATFRVCGVCSDHAFPEGYGSQHTPVVSHLMTFSSQDSCAYVEGPLNSSALLVCCELYPAWDLAFHRGGPQPLCHSRYVQSVCCVQHSVRCCRYLALHINSCRERNSWVVARKASDNRRTKPVTC